MRTWRPAHYGTLRWSVEASSLRYLPLVCPTAIWLLDRLSCVNSNSCEFLQPNPTWSRPVVLIIRLWDTAACDRLERLGGWRYSARSSAAYPVESALGSRL